jgi:D-alanyl-D-alanine dipeptidase
MMQKLSNDVAFLMAHELLGIVVNCLRPEEQRDAFEAFFEVCKRGLNTHETHADTMHQRMSPSNN